MEHSERILLVDDHEDNLFALESALAHLGSPLERATCGSDALKAVLRGGIGLVVLDVMMPDLSGLDVVRHMQRVEQTEHIPVILLTGFGRDPELIKTAYNLGVADLVMKPVDPWALRTKARYLMGVRQRMRLLERELEAAHARSAETLSPPSQNPFQVRVPEQPTASSRGSFPVDDRPGRGVGAPSSPCEGRTA
ncbi:response regulator [Streptomyces sp. NBC_01304]|uniref:response regulator n=1 Tax=Streptomyces sp. NBC_01304 TaxID=2903818 RepID=UPI002E12E7AC|nr:response regulator [Streptomyces sp. NBC_01304]